MDRPHPRRWPLATIRGLMIAIAAIGVVLGLLVASPYLFLPMMLILFVGLAAVGNQRGREWNWIDVIWMILLIQVIIPLTSIAFLIMSFYVHR